MNATGPVTPPARARDTYPTKLIHQGSEGGGRGLVRRDITCEGFLEGVLSTGDPIGRSEAIMAAIDVLNESFRRGGLDRTSELLCGVGKVDRRGKERTEMQKMSLSPRCLYASLTSAV